MKTIILTLFASVFLFAQEFKIEEKSITGLFENKEHNKSELFAKINKWISINYNSAKNVIQMNDAESGTIIIKGINEVKYKNISKILYPKMAVPEFSTTKFNHLIEINIKDNKYRINYKLVDMIGIEGNNYDILFFNCIKLNGNRDIEVQKYIDLIETSLRKGMIGKDKRNLYLSETKSSLDEINLNLINDIKSTMLSIEKSISKNQKDDW